ncbi:MAG TPA: hypothetical protein VM324_02925 [Egibacteraceae bacterium]|jgi:hypothetical protein|nr:hypothetical protein [Egibacteraceae bacterium]
MLGGCLALVIAFVGLAVMAVAMWEYPPALLVLLIPFFIGRRAWRNHLEWVGRAQAEVQHSSAKG